MPAVIPTFKKVNNTFYKLFNVSDLTRAEKTQFILEAMNNDASRVYEMFQTKYPDLLEEFEIKKQWGTPDYLKLNNPIEEVREMITININKLRETKVMDDILDSVITDIMNLTVPKLSPAIVPSTPATQMSMDEVNELLKELRDMKATLKSETPITQPEPTPTTTVVEPTVEEMKEAIIEAAIEADIMVDAVDTVEEVVDNETEWA